MEGEYSMSHFYGKISESARKTQPTARAHHSLRVEAQSWQGKIVTRLIRDKDGDTLRYGESHTAAAGENTFCWSRAESTLKTNFQKLPNVVTGPLFQGPWISLK
jgi:hypothetical protein